MTIEEAMSKIKKLLSLSTSSNQHEASLAAAKAAAIMEEYQITEASLVQDPEKDEPVGSFEIDGKSNKKIHWRMAVAGGCATVCNCSVYWYGSRIMMIGRENDVRAAQYLFGMISPQVDRLAEECYQRETPWEDKRRWMHAFRLGCARTIQNRMYVQHREMQSKLKTDAQNRLAIEDGGNSTTALMVIDRRLAKVEDFKQKLGLKKGTSSRISSSSGYAQGREAGQKVHIGGSARGAIGSGPRLIGRN